MALDEPSTQLLQELRSAVKSSFTWQDPILHHLNADTSWLLQIPRPDHAIKHGSRFYYNILIDPWLRGGQSDVASWFSQQFHSTPSAIQSQAELEELMREIEMLAQTSRTPVTNDRSFNVDVMDGVKTLLDAVIISHQFTDHCHKLTLLELCPDVPVFAIREAAILIESWKHFRSITTISVFGAEGVTDWRSTSLSPLPKWIGVSRLLQRDDVLNYHSALMIVFDVQREITGVESTPMDKHTRKWMANPRHITAEPVKEDECAKAIVYTPHGIDSGDLEFIPSAEPPISTLAFLHGLHNVRVGTASGHTALQSNLGGHNGLRAQRILKAKYWIGTHDEIKKGGGLVAWFLQRDIITLKDALDYERKIRQGRGKSSASGEIGAILDAFDDTNWIDLRNGESRVLCN